LAHASSSSCRREVHSSKVVATQPVLCLCACCGQERTTHSYSGSAHARITIKMPIVKQNAMRQMLRTDVCGPHASNECGCEQRCCWQSDQFALLLLVQALQTATTPVQAWSLHSTSYETRKMVKAAYYYPPVVAVPMAGTLLPAPFPPFTAAAAFDRPKSHPWIKGQRSAK
jgi:hypothetical protein